MSLPTDSPSILRLSRRLSTIHGHLNASSTPSSLCPSGACGIIAMVGKEPALPFLLDGLRILENRGYDSAGISTISASPGSSSNELRTSKFASQGSTCDALEILRKNVSPHTKDIVGIAHTRWATHGARTDKNAHPHLDQSGRIAVVHNGVIENAGALRSELESAHGVVFHSETDTEVIAQLIGVYVVRDGLDLLDAMIKAQERMEGTWGLVVLDRDHPEKLLASKNGSPLLVGICSDKKFVASEAAAFNQHTKEYIELQDGEIAILSADEHSLDRSRIELAPDEQVAITPDPYPHWTLKEIMEQPEAVARALNYGGRFLDSSRVKLGGMDANKESLSAINSLVIAACGTSYYASLYGAHIMRRLGCFDTVQVVDASELSVDFLPHVNGGLLAVSQSGETKDVHRALTTAIGEGLTCFSIVNAVRSLIARTTKCGVYLNAGREHAVASTKAFTCQATVMAQIAVWFAQTKRPEQTARMRAEVIEALHRLPTNVGMTLRSINNQCKKIAEHLKDARNAFILGRGDAHPIAMEGALKIKEITYLQAEGYPGGALKHGPYALIEEGTPIFLLLLDDEKLPLMETAAEEVKTRGAYTIVITDSRGLRISADEVIHIPKNGVLTSLLGVLPLQLIAYHVSVMRGINPDRPRNLAKAVTVD